MISRIASDLLKIAPGMPSKKKAPRAKITRLRAQTRAIRVVNAVLMALFGLSLGGLTVASALPQKRKLAEKQAELERVLEQERQVIAAKEDAQAGCDAISEDPEYLEIHAVDRLNVHRPGTTIFRMEREN